MPWKKLKVDRGWPPTWQRCGKNDRGHAYCVMMEKRPDGTFRWGWTQGPNEVDPINGWTRPVGGTARVAKAQADEHLRFLVGKGGTLGQGQGPTREFQWLARDVSLAFRRGDCDSAKTIAAKMLLRARTPKERNAVFRVQNKVRSCVLRQPDIGRAKARRRRAR